MKKTLALPSDTKCQWLNGPSVPARFKIGECCPQDTVECNKEMLARVVTTMKNSA